MVRIGFKVKVVSGERWRSGWFLGKFNVYWLIINFVEWGKGCNFAV